MTDLYQRLEHFKARAIKAEEENKRLKRSYGHMKDFYEYFFRENRLLRNALLKSGIECVYHKNGSCPLIGEDK